MEEIQGGVAGAAVSMSGECQVFDGAGPPSAILAIAPSEVRVCRDLLDDARGAYEMVCSTD